MDFIGGTEDDRRVQTVISVMLGMQRGKDN